MTSLISWIAFDNNKASSAYILTDSQVTWGDKGKWLNSQKTFVSSKFPDLLGYCGDSLFVSQAILRYLFLLDNNLFYNINITDGHERVILFKEFIEDSLKTYPKTSQINSTEFIYISREREDKYKFLFYHISISNQKVNIYPIEISSFDKQKYISLGSGKKIIEKDLKKYIEYSNLPNPQKTDKPLLSSYYFYSFLKSLKEKKDNETGGAPQLVGLFNEKIGSHFGIIYQNELYFAGMKVNNNSINCKYWRNENFENSDPITKKRKEKAKREYNPYP